MSKAHNSLFKNISECFLKSIGDCIGTICYYDLWRILQLHHIENNFFENLKSSPVSLVEIQIPNG
ncbi:hypothetical protein BpHYR1_013978 [Brachionus plicatilis]|uniref:Uncharacterized protein n=1 Tax=Brachionus plicatilis TaxID=10195 RepID=A0A3M7SSG1_BRAPC|nr:hypothetical protein BpHYR1_013978 [Brachionus plicatilis]